jgi:hypothetical protein
MTSTGSPVHAWADRLTWTSVHPEVVRRVPGLVTPAWAASGRGTAKPSAADAGRKVLAGEGGAGGDEVGGCALEDDPAAVGWWAMTMTDWPRSTIRSACAMTA